MSGPLMPAQDATAPPRATSEPGAPELASGLSVEDARRELGIDEDALIWLASRGLLTPRWDGQRFTYRADEVAARRASAAALLALRVREERSSPRLLAIGLAGLALPPLALGAALGLPAAAAHVVLVAGGLASAPALAASAVSLARWNQIRERRLTHESWRRTFAARRAASV